MRDAIATTRHGALDELAHPTAELGVWDALEVIQVHREREGVPDGLLLRTLTVLPFIEAVGLSAAANTLFQDAAILLQLGYVVFEIQNGFDVRYIAGRKQTRDVSAAAESDLSSWESFVQATLAAGVPGAKLWGCLLHAVDRDTGAVEDWALV
ncbi:MAG: hypothetical protein KGJ80_07860, partial [Chloroflexota bacterium]|nr:hypothetical protein [Chloroflexota bacterium]